MVLTWRKVPRNEIRYELRDWGSEPHAEYNFSHQIKPGEYKACVTRNFNNVFKPRWMGTIRYPVTDGHIHIKTLYAMSSTAAMAAVDLVI